MTHALAEWSVTTLDVVHHMDWRVLMNALPARSVDMVLTDMPYGTTACSWDTVIDLGAWWVQVWRVVKERAAVVCTASQPFTTTLVNSCLERFRYEWIWEKDNGTNFLMLDWQPFKVHENVLVFSAQRPIYEPQYMRGKPYRLSRGTVYRDYLGAFEKGTLTVNGGFRHPRSVQRFNQQRGEHPTQKPVALFEYLIRTYTQPGAVVLDPFVGSGTTALAARNTGRRFICGDISREYVEIARARLAQPYTLSMFDTHEHDTAPEAHDSADAVEQLALFEDERPARAAQ